MRKVYSHENLSMAWHVRNVLEQHDIDCLVKNDRLYSVAGELPIHECQAEVWIRNPLYFRRAEEIIRAMENELEEPGEDWQCPHCGESNLGNYAACWSCAALPDCVPES